MKASVALICLLVGSALASLEPAGYRTPSRSYLAPPPTPANRYIPASSDTYRGHQVVDARRTPPSTSYGVPDYRGSYAHQRQQDQHYEPAKYDFGYRVRDNRGNDYGHQEAREGSLTRGSYSVLLPDGRRQLVEYEADEAGFRPRISYEIVDARKAGY